MRTIILAVSAVWLLTGSGAPPQTGAASSSQAPLPADLDRLLAPIALYPDPLLAQMLMCSTDPVALVALNDFLKSNPTLKGTELQDAATKNKFEPSFVALALFPTVVKQMVVTLAQTTDLGKAFKAHRPAVFESIQRLRTQAHDAGTLKTTAQQEVEKKTTESGQQVIVIEPANPQVVYVPQYNPTVVYTQPTTVVVQQQSSSTDAAVAGLIGFTAGIAIGAAIDNDYYYGPYGWHGGAGMYNDAWDDYYDHREDAREDWQDHREDLADERGDRAGKAQEERTERAGERTERAGERQGTTSAANREGASSTAAKREGAASTAKREGGASAATTKGGSTYGSRGYSEPQDRARTTTTKERSGSQSGAFSGYSGGKSERAASSRGSSSRSSSRSKGGGGGRRR
jgi:hypothetical protein